MEALEGVFVRELSLEEFKRYSEKAALMHDALALLKDVSEGVCEDDAVKEAVQMLERLCGAGEERKYYGIFAGREYAGYLAFRGYETETPEIAIELEESWQGKGIGYRFLKAETERIFKERTDVRYFRYRVADDNLPSIKLIEKLGGCLMGIDHSTGETVMEYRIYRS
ncbi:MAG: GNAT family N-acetyltransferase [Clostridia bacterium]|nr:GNAT family N-acetyltransferase [Clostridia bacterium]